MQSRILVLADGLLGWCEPSHIFVILCVACVSHSRQRSEAAQSFRCLVMLLLQGHLLHQNCAPLKSRTGMPVVCVALLSK